MRFIVLLFVSLWGLNVQAKELIGVNVSEEKTVSGTLLKLNGAAVRTVFILKVKVYVVAFYTPEPLKTEQDVLSAKGPLRFDFTFVRDVAKKKVAEAWAWQFDDSVTYRYPDYEKDKATFIASLGALKKGGVEAVEIEGDETRVFDDGELKATIKGKDFQKAFLDMWFGKKAVTPEIKAALLGK